MARTREQRVSEVLRHFGANVAVLRRSRGYSQQALAELVECDVRFVQRVERAARIPSFTMVVVFADVLGVPVADLFAEREPEPARPGRPRKDGAGEGGDGAGS